MFDASSAPSSTATCAGGVRMNLTWIVGLHQDAALINRGVSIGDGIIW
jgi:hypothetical protein